MYTSRKCNIRRKVKTKKKPKFSTSDFSDRKLCELKWEYSLHKRKSSSSLRKLNLATVAGSTTLTTAMQTPSSPPSTTLEDVVPPTSSEEGISVDKLNNPETLGISIRLKDLALIAASSGTSLSLSSSLDSFYTSYVILSSTHSVLYISPPLPLSFQLLPLSFPLLPCSTLIYFSSCWISWTAGQKQLSTFLDHHPHSCSSVVSNQ